MTVIKDIDSRIARKLASIRKPFRGRLHGIANTKPGVTLISGIGLAGEPIQDNELFQHYGITTCPPEGSEFIVLPIGGKTSQGVIIATEHGTYRLKGLKPGEVALYSDEGDSVVLKRGRLIEATTVTFKINASNKVEMNTPLLQVNGGDIKADDISLKEHRTSGVTRGSQISDGPVA